MVLAHISRALSESPFIKLAKAIKSKEETSWNQNKLYLSLFSSNRIRLSAFEIISEDRSIGAKFRNDRS